MGQGLSCGASDEHGLFSAVQLGDLETVEALVERDSAILRHTTVYDRHSALHIAAANGQIEILSLLLERSVNPDALNRHKQTPLMLVAMHGKISCVRKLLEVGANVLMFDSLHRRTCLHYAAYYGHADCRQNAIQLAEKEKREKELLSQIIEEAEDFKVEFYQKRKITSENNKAANREKEKMFVASQEKFHAEVDKNYWKAVADLIPNEVPAIEKRGKKDQEKKPSIVVVQGPKPGKPTELSRMRQILLKLKHNTPPHLKPSPPALAIAPEAVVAAVADAPEAIAAA